MRKWTKRMNGNFDKKQKENNSQQENEATYLW